MDGHEGTTCMRLTDHVAEATDRQRTNAAAEATVRRGRSVILGGSTHPGDGHGEVVAIREELT